MKQKEYLAINGISYLKKILDEEGWKNIFLVTGKSSYEISGAKSQIEEIFNEKNCNYSRFSDLKPNPQLSSIHKGLMNFKDSNAEAIFAIGGGSPIDVAKAIKLFHKNKTNKSIPLVAIPTTAGSGSEATSFIVYYEGKKKISAGAPDITLPNYSLLDPCLTLSLPKKIAASSGLDALCQATESYWSIHSTSESKEYSKKSIHLLLDDLPEATHTKNLIPKYNVLEAANLAGKAINITKTTACHSIAYPMTSYFNITHGHAVALTLGKMMEYNENLSEKDCLDARGINHTKKSLKELKDIFNCKEGKQFSQKIKRLMENLELETKLSNLGITLEGIETIVENGFTPERVKNNPRKLTKESLKEILYSVY